MIPSSVTIISNSATLELIKLYIEKVIVTAQAKYDRWPEAHAMHRLLIELGARVGISDVEVDADLKYAPINCDLGRRW